MPSIAVLSFGLPVLCSNRKNQGRSRGGVSRSSQDSGMGGVHGASYGTHYCYTVVLTTVTQSSSTHYGYTVVLTTVTQ